MRLTEKQAEIVSRRARELGVSEDEIIKRLPSSDDAPASEDKSGPGQPTAERFLIGFLPFVTVKEFRTNWLRLEQPIVDDHLPTGEWLTKHGQAGGVATDTSDDG